MNTSSLTKINSFSVLTVTVSAAADVVADPAALLNTARNFLPLSPGVGMKVNVGDVAAPMSVNVAPPSELLCHWAVGSGMPVAAATNVAGWPAATVKSIGCNVIDGSTDAT